MPLISFEATSAQIFGGAGQFEKPVPGLSYGVRLHEDESIDLTTDEKFSDLDGRVTLFPDTESKPEIARDAIGVMHYFPGHFDIAFSTPPSYIVEAWISTALFDELRTAARHGCVPSGITADVVGLTYGSMPDGRPLKWNNKDEASQHLKLSSIKFTVPLHSMDSGGEHDRTTAEGSMPPTRTQIDALTKQVEQLTTETKTRLRALLWVLVTIGVIFLLLRWNK